ncbi:MAG: YbaB/EbfC family nucleoid-associated protein [Anaerovoracaceae bacterium]
MGKGMKAGKKPSMGGGKGNMQKQLAQVQAMQAMMEKTQEEIESKEFETSAGGGAVTVKVNGKKELLSINLKPEVVDPDDIEMLQDLILAAVNEAMRQVDELSEQEMGKVTGGINIPGIF